jgi:hypothetical protein
VQRKRFIAGLAVIAATACDGAASPRGEPPPSVGATREVPAAPVEPEPAQTWPPTPPIAPSAEPPVADPDARPIREFTELEHDRDLTASQRVRGAHDRKRAEVRALFDEAGVDFPPGQLLFRVFKHERQLEIWASHATRGPLTHVATYSICAASGVAGPKTREGDWQVPEGFYAIDMFNPRSRFHLSMRVDYPNARDRSLRSTGGQIMIHGDCMSVGCVALGDERIEELWVMADALRRGRPHVHLLPGRDLEGLIADANDPELARFWEGLLAVDKAFAADRMIPRVAWDNHGVYRPRG